ncbi:hypothetical protein [Kitasatospora sp. NPDC057015]|uniref:hypothetical protein n=1 Tax=Kitasatospora sp. NPDC057015 TaxID=3346001 RepID=UPI003633CB8C
MPEPRPRQAAGLAHDATLRAARAFADLAESIDALDPEEAAEVLHGLFLPPGPAHALAGILHRFGAWAADGWENPRVYEPLIREAAELTLGAYRVSAVAHHIAALDAPPAISPRPAAALATSPAARAAQPHSVIQGPAAPAAAAVPPARITEPLRH